MSISSKLSQNMPSTTVASDKPPSGGDVEKFVSLSDTVSFEQPQRRFSSEAERAVVRKLDRRVVS